MCWNKGTKNMFSTFHSLLRTLGPGPSVPLLMHRYQVLLLAPALCCFFYKSTSTSGTLCNVLWSDAPVSWKPWYFPGWEVVVTGSQGHEDVKMVSRVTATFSVQLCAKPEGSTTCQAVETRTVHVVRSRRGAALQRHVAAVAPKLLLCVWLPSGFLFCCWE